MLGRKLTITLKSCGVYNIDKPLSVSQDVTALSHLKPHLFSDLLRFLTLISTLVLTGPDVLIPLQDSAWGPFCLL